MQDLAFSMTPDQRISLYTTPDRLSLKVVKQYLGFSPSIILLQSTLADSNSEVDLSKQGKDGDDLLMAKNSWFNKFVGGTGAARTLSEPDIQGTLPVPRDSHNCMMVGDKLFVFRALMGTYLLRICMFWTLVSSINTWMMPYVRGEGPEAREGHSAVVVGKRLFIFWVCGKSSDTHVEEYFDDLYILNTKTMVWKRVATTGIPPAKHNSYTCVSWKNKIIVIGGEDTQNYYMSDVQMLDTDTLTWTKFITNGELLPPRAGHTTVALGKNLLVFGGFTDAEDLYDDLYMFDLEKFRWTKVITLGVGPSARFSMAGSTLHPQHGGVLIFMGSCNKSLEALDDMLYLHAGLINYVITGQNK
ncbi:putative kelch-type beta propeller [Helianthus anomalus]